jgi:endonuclease/exonuclease/phosphatase family metal-dependent hydrolase
MNQDPSAAALAAVHAVSHRRSNRHSWLRVLPWLYLLLVVALILFMRLAGERWVLATLMLYGPRWLILIPLLPMAYWAARYHRRSLLPLAIAAGIVLGPLMGFCFPWGRFRRASTPSITILSCNTKGHCSKNERLNKLVHQSGVDVVVLQDCFQPVDIDWPLDWNILQKGELLFASPFPLKYIVPPADLGYDNDHREKVLLCSVVLPQGELRLATVHLQSPHVGIARVINRRHGLEPDQAGAIEEESDERWQESKTIASGLLDAKIDAVVGDFNLTDDNPIYRRYWSSFTDAFGACGFGFGGTERPTVWFPYRVRIDHVLTRGVWRPSKCWVEDEVGSDHLPIVARIYASDEVRRDTDNRVPR